MDTEVYHVYCEQCYNKYDYVGGFISGFQFLQVYIKLLYLSHSLVINFLRYSLMINQSVWISYNNFVPCAYYNWWFVRFFLARAILLEQSKNLSVISITFPRWLNILIIIFLQLFSICISYFGNWSKILPIYLLDYLLFA